VCHILPFAKSVIYEYGFRFTDLIPLFLFISFSYSSVGLGGGSSYTAVLSIVGLSQVLIPTVSLSMNIIVTASATIQFLRHGHLKWGILLPFVIASVPAAYFGGSLQLSEGVFQSILLVSLVAVAARIYLWKDPILQFPDSRIFRIGLSLFLGGMLGFIAGSVGIGGGIYLVPLIIVTGIAEMKTAAATGAAFILINSIAGLVARSGWTQMPWDLIVPLGITALIGGMAGSFLGSSRWEPKTVQRILGIVILVAIVLLGQKLIG